VVSFGVVVSTVFIEGDDLVRVVGTSHYQEALHELAGPQPGDERTRFECTATLVPEPDNPHDPDAVAVQINDTTVGYLARDEHPRWREVVDTLAQHGRLAEAAAMIAGRGGLLGVFLRLPTPTEAKAQVGIALREEQG
jgi:hypothetical protein